MHPTYLTRVESHFREVIDDLPFDVQDEIDQAKSSRDIRTLVPLTREGIQHISQFYPPVRNAADLDSLPGRLKGDGEYGFSPLFDPLLVDECCQRGIFPLTQDIGRGFYLFTPKVHRVRAVCALAGSAAERNTIGGFPFCEDQEGIFNCEAVGVSRKLLKSPDDASRRPCFEAFLNREEDVADVFTLIRKQHGENWLCKALRLCFLHIFFHPDKYKTKIIVTAVRRKKYSGELTERSVQEISEGELVAGEVGFLVGDIYSSASGAYCISGGGALQLSVTGSCMQAAGCRVWDLGMMMEYKKGLNCLEFPRMKWLRLLAARRSNSSVGIQSYLHGLENGQCVTFFLRRPTQTVAIDPNSKSQQKKRMKREALAERKHTQK